MTFWDQVWPLFGLEESRTAQTVAILDAETFGISLALRDVAKAFVNCVYVLIERPFRIGDRIRVENVERRVEEIVVRLTRLRAELPEATVATRPPDENA